MNDMILKNNGMKNVCCFIGHREIDETQELKTERWKTIEHIVPPFPGLNSLVSMDNLLKNYEQKDPTALQSVFSSGILIAVKRLAIIKRRRYYEKDYCVNIGSVHTGRICTHRLWQEV